MAHYMDTSEYDWQSSKSVIECNRHMWKHRLLCDVKFRVGAGREIIEAHKYVLASRSCVFYAMFSDAMLESRGHVIDIPDIEPEIFRAVMQFLYEDNIDLTIENSLKVMDTAKTYAIQGLVNKCLNLLKTSMTVNTVCRTMEIAHINNKDELRHRCLNFILANTEKVFDNLSELCSDCLCLILQDENLLVEEAIVFFACLRYADLKCQASRLRANGENRRTMLGGARLMIRFPSMSQEFFTDNVEPSGILTDSECVKVFKYYINPQNDCDPFIVAPRNVQRRASRFLEMASGWGYKRDKQDAITFTCSHDIVMQGVELYCVSEDSANYEIKLVLTQLPFNAVIQTKNAIAETNSKDKTFKLLFNDPAVIKRNKDYAIVLMCRGPPSYYGVKGLNLVEEDGVRFTFKHNERSSNNTTVQRGQIASIVYSITPDRTAN